MTQLETALINQLEIMTSVHDLQEKIIKEQQELIAILKNSLGLSTQERVTQGGIHG